MAVIAAPDLEGFATNILEAAGFTPQDAAQMADLLVWANLRGIPSHGVLRLPRYVEMLQLGEVRADHDIAVVQQFGAIMVLDADRAPGATAMNRAVKEAANLARVLGLGWCGVRNTSHAGAIGYFVRQLAEQGLIGIAITASKPLMSYFGAKGEALSTNPLAIGIPAPDGAPPLILDMSTAAVALGKIMAAKDAGQTIPVGWGIDAEGADTTDPHKVAAVLPMAGAKGSGLAFMIEILCSLLVANPNIAPALSGGKAGGFNGMVLAIDPAAFGGRAAFMSQVGELSAAIHALEPAPNHKEVLLPGQRGHNCELVARDSGVSLAAGTLKRLATLASQLGVVTPAAFQ